MQWSELLFFVCGCLCADALMGASLTCVFCLAAFFF